MRPITTQPNPAMRPVLRNPNNWSGRFGTLTIEGRLGKLALNDKVTVRVHEHHNDLVLRFDTGQQIRVSQNEIAALTVLASQPGAVKPEGILGIPISVETNAKAPETQPQIKFNSPAEALVWLTFAMNGALTRQVERLEEAASRATSNPASAAPGQTAAMNASQASAATASMQGAQPRSLMGASMANYAANVENRVKAQALSVPPKMQQWANDFNTDPKNREYTMKKNAETRKEMAEVRQTLQDVHLDPKLSPKDRAKKTKKLQDKMNVLNERIASWPMDPARINQRIYDILENPSLTKGQKKDRIKAIRDGYQFRYRDKNGWAKDDFKTFFRDRIKKVVDDGKKSIEKRQKSMNKQLDAQVRSIEKIHGRDSSVAQTARLAAERVKEDVEGAAKPSLDRLKEKSSVLKSIYPSFWGKFFGFFKNLLPMLTPLLNFIPGVGQALYAAAEAAKFAYSAAKGNILGAVTGAVGAVAGAGGAIGGVAGKVTSYAQKAVGYVRQGYAFAKGVANGDVLGSLQAAVGALTPVASNNPVAQKLLDYTKDGVTFTKAIATGRYADALGTLAGHIEQTGVVTPEMRKVASWANDGRLFLGALGDGRYADAANGFLGRFETTFGKETSDRLRAAVDGFTDLKNPAKLAGLVDGLAGGRLSSELGRLRELGREFFEDEDVRNFVRFTRAGQSFVNELTKGRVDGLLDQIRTENPELARAIQSIRTDSAAANSFIGSLASGEFEKTTRILNPQVYIKLEPVKICLENTVWWRTLCSSDWRKIDKSLGQARHVIENERLWTEIEELEEAAADWKFRHGAAETVARLTGAARNTIELQRHRLSTGVTYPVLFKRV